MKSLFYSLSSLLLLAVTGCETTPNEVSGPKRAESSSVAQPTAASATSTRVTRPSGLQYQVLTSGPAGGRSPTLNDSVVVHYHGTLTDGTVFDSSVERGQPITLGVNQVIPGWTEALQLMKPGDKWMLYIPFTLGYGSRSTGKIPAYSDLIFQVELLQIVGG